MGDKICPLLLAANPSNVGGKAACRTEDCALWQRRGYCCSIYAIGQAIGEVEKAAKHENRRRELKEMEALKKSLDEAKLKNQSEYGREEKE